MEKSLQKFDIFIFYVYNGLLKFLFFNCLKMAWEKIIDWISSKENVSDKHEWVKEQVKTELTDLKMDVLWFYESDPENPEKIKYNLDAVKNYLSELIKGMDGKSDREAWQYLRWSQTRSYAWIMAVQIALESLWEGWDTDVNKIDGLLWWAGSHTRRAVENFQKKYNETHDNKLSPDGLPGRATITALLEVMGWVVTTAVETQEDSKEDSFKEVKVKEEIELPAEEVKAQDLVEVPEWAIVEFKEGKWVDKEKTEEQEVVVIVKIWEDTKEIKIIVKIEDGKIKIEERKEDEKKEDDEDKSEGEEGDSEKENMVESLSLNEDYPKYLYTWNVDPEGEPNWRWSVEFKWGKNSVNRFEWVREHWRITECTSYGNTIKIKYNTEWDAIFETNSWKTLKIENKNISHVGRTASIINYIFKVVWDSGKKFDHFYMNPDHHLRVNYKDDSYKKVLSNAYFQMKIDYSEDLVGRLNEYSKEVEK